MTREVKRISFNKDREKKLLEFARSVDFSKTVKVLLVESKQFKEFCGECSCGDTLDEHSCPYDDELNGGGGFCSCCAYCTNQCAMSV